MIRAMRRHTLSSSSLVAAALLLVACGSNKNPGVDVCGFDPPPAECMASCDPGGANTCSSGFHCGSDGTCTAECTASGGECGSGRVCTSDGHCESAGACVNLECQQVTCTGGGDTTLSGTVFAPNGTLPLYGVTVYVPNADPGALPDGAQCSRCNDALPGQPLTQTVTDETGHFTLHNVPAGEGIPVVITSGKWRKQIELFSVASCQDTALTAEQTRLPAKKSEGDIPQMAISTGNADALECLFRKLGIDDSEFTTDAGDGRVHMYSDTMASDGEGADRFRTGFPGGAGNFTDSQTLWEDLDKMKGYDILIFSCEGGQFPETKSQAAMDAVKAYADLGGRVFLSHWHNVWIQGAGFEGGSQQPSVWPDIAEWNNSRTTFDGLDTIDEVSNSKGGSFATWMLNVMGSPARDQIPIGTGSGKNTCESVDTSKAERWVYWVDGNDEFPQNFQFTTPNEVSLDQRCGKVVFSDMHVSGDSKSAPGGPGFPSDCSSDALTPQEKALAFMLFDLASCIVVVE
jgi:hypothetical protein